MTSWRTTSGALIGDVIVAFCTQSISRKIHEPTNGRTQLWTELFMIQKLSWGLFYPQMQYEG